MLEARLLLKRALQEGERLTGAASYFARPFHSWERGSDENANGLARRYPSKGARVAGACFSGHSTPDGD